MFDMSQQCHRLVKTLHQSENGFYKAEHNGGAGYGQVSERKLR